MSLSMTTGAFVHPDTNCGNQHIQVWLFFDFQVYMGFISFLYHHYISDRDLCSFPMFPDFIRLAVFSAPGFQWASPYELL